MTVATTPPLHTASEWCLFYFQLLDSSKHPLRFLLDSKEGFGLRISHNKLGLGVEYASGTHSGISKWHDDRRWQSKLGGVVSSGFCRTATFTRLLKTYNLAPIMLTSMGAFRFWCCYVPARHKAGAKDFYLVLI